jgi:hypothetical protein
VLNKSACVSIDTIAIDDCRDGDHERLNGLQSARGGTVHVQLRVHLWRLQRERALYGEVIASIARPFVVYLEEALMDPGLDIWFDLVAV